MIQQAANRIDTDVEPSVESSMASDVVSVAVPDSTLYIVGNNSFQNALLKAYLQERLDSSCQIQTKSNWDSDQICQSPEAVLILYDCFGQAPSDIWIKLGLNQNLDPSVMPIALFNTIKDPDEDFEKQAIEKQLRGVFYISEPPERLPKGIEKMLQGELWYSRKITSAILMENQRYRAQAEVAEIMLTPREKEILVAIASGAGNSAIASEFFISLHTVTTHIYNIYKKIDVHNRLEATLWVARYL
jgi:DNA-binding NarL/FixJ family response regulator